MSAATLDTAFKILEIVVLIGGVGGVLFRLGQAVSKFEAIGSQQSQEITELKIEVRSFRDVLTTVTVQKAELANLRDDISRLMEWYDELRHGIGVITSRPSG